MSNTREHWILWVCTNCFHHAANGECGDCHNSDGHEGGEPLSLLSNEACPGMGWEDHNEECVRYQLGGEPNFSYECDCETKTFSTSTCEGCGSTYHGERHVMTEWSE